MMMTDTNDSVVELHEMNASTPTDQLTLNSDASSLMNPPPGHQSNAPSSSSMMLFHPRQPSPGFEAEKLSRASTRRNSRQPSRSNSRPSSRHQLFSPPSATAAATAAGVVGVGMSALSQATPISAFHSNEFGLIVPPRLVRFPAWVSIYLLFTLIWIASTGYACGALSSLFWSPSVATNENTNPVSSSWVQAGWVLNWFALLLQILLLISMIRTRSPYTSFVTMGSLMQFTVAALAAICHSNSLNADQVLSPLSDNRATVIQIEWLSVALMLLSFLSLLYHTPRRVVVPLMTQLAPRSKTELMSLARHLQSEIESLSHLWESNRHKEIATFANANTNTNSNGSNATFDRMPVSPLNINQTNIARSLIINPMASISRSKSQAIRSARGIQNMSWMQTANNNNNNSSSNNLNAIDSQQQQELTNSRRNSANKFHAAAAAVALLAATDSRAHHRKGMTQGDKDLAKMMMALRSAELGPDTLNTNNNTNNNNTSITPRGDTFLQYPPPESASIRGTKSTRKSRRSSKAHHGGEGSIRSIRSSRKHNGVQSLGQDNDFFAQAQRIIQQQQLEALEAEPR